MADQATREAAADLIDGAIDVIHKQGWCQHVLTDEAGRVCLVEALALAGAWDQPLASSSAWAAIAAEAGCDDVLGPLDFNNHPSTTKSDVLLTMKRAAHSLRDGAL